MVVDSGLLKCDIAFCVMWGREVAEMVQALAMFEVKHCSKGRSPSELWRNIDDILTL